MFQFIALVVRNPQLRRMVRETVLTTSDLIYPLCHTRRGIAKKLNHAWVYHQLSVDKIVEEARKSTISASQIILFGIPEDKDSEATGAWYDCGIVQNCC